MMKLLMSAFVACSAIAFPAAQQFEMVDVRDLRQEDMGKSMMDMPSNVVVAIPEGAAMPVQIALTGDVLEVSDGGASAAQMTFKKPVYFRMSKQGPLLSFDMKSWKPIFDCFTGEISLAIEPVDSGLLFKCFGSAFNQK